MIKINDPIYGQGFNLIVNCSIEQFNKEVDRKTKQANYLELDSSVDGVVIDVHAKKGKYSFVYVAEFKWTAESIGVLSHEIYHHCRSVFNHCKITDMEEAFAYYQEMIFTQCLLKIKKSK